MASGNGKKLLSSSYTNSSMNGLFLFMRPNLTGIYYLEADSKLLQLPMLKEGIENATAELQVLNTQPATLLYYTVT